MNEIVQIGVIVKNAMGQRFSEIVEIDGSETPRAKGIGEFISIVFMWPKGPCCHNSEGQGARPNKNIVERRRPP